MQQIMSIAKVFESKLWQAVWQFLFRAFIMIGLPLLGWGLDDLAGFFASPVRVCFVVVATAQGAINAWLVYRMPPLSSEEPFEPFHAHFDIVEMIFFLAAFNARRSFMTWNVDWALGWLGLGIYLIGSGLSSWTNFTWVSHLRHEGERACSDPVLLREGPFRWIRYPGLLCLGLYSLGFAIMFQSWLGLVLMIPLMIIFARRINILERANAERYPKVWLERCQTSRRIIPFVY
jgi:protein-S-isoprenylcysteine O-methyltransferase Ste14